MKKLLTLILTLSAFMSIGQTSMRSGIEAYYKLEESSGVVIDQTGNHNGTNNSATTGSTGIIGDCYDFDGTNGYVDIGAFGALTSITISCWIYLDATGSYDGIVFSRVSGTSGINLNSAGTSLGYTWNGAANTYSWNSGLAATTGAWVFVALVVTPTNATMYRGYSGELTNSVNSVSHSSSTLNNIYIGYDSYTASRHIDGRMDEVIISKRPYLSQEVSMLYNSGTGLFYVYDNWINKKITDEEFSNYYWDYLGYANTGADSTNP